MIIEREDVERVKDLARKVAAIQDPVQIHHLEVGFKNHMAAKYGEKEAIRLLTKVWQLSAARKDREDVSEIH